MSFATIYPAGIGFVLAFTLSYSFSAQTTHPAHRISSVPDSLLTRTVPLRTGIGRAHDTVSTTVKEAQAFYDQGLAYLHTYVWLEAARSFNQALRLDPKLAMAHLGLTYAYTELNLPARATDALQGAQALGAGASRHDRAHIAARALQMAAESAPREPAKLAAYRRALDEATTAHPADAEFWLLRGIAESNDPADRGQGSPAGAIKYYDKALAMPDGALGAHHYLTHAHENAGRAKEALPHAASFAASAAAIPHAQHMHGHVLRRLGRIDEAIARFEEADRLASAYFKHEGIPAEYEWHYAHNLDLLASSYVYLGQVAKAERLLKTAFETPSALLVQVVNKRAWPDFLTARGRTMEAAAAAGVLIAHPSPVVRAAGHVSAGHALAAAGQLKQAADAANAALRELRAAPEVAGLASTGFEMLQGEFFLRTGQREKGRALLQEAARKVRAAPGPDAWVQALFTLEAMARAARAAGDWEFAGWAARQMLDHDPNYAGSHYAAALVAEHNGEVGTARSEFAAAMKLWAKADAGLEELRNIRSRN
jgi:tetratricopeptide (TPR) repeat protein